MIVQTQRERQVGDIEAGEHLCLLFADGSEERRVLSRYLTTGLHRHERVLCFTDRRSPTTVLTWLQSTGVDVDSMVRQGQLQVRSAENSYLPSGRFDADSMLATLDGEIDASLRAGFAGLRICGEVGWALRGVPGADQLERYESEVGEVFAGRPASAICQYDARQFDHDQLRRIDRCHHGRVALSPLYRDAVLQIVPSFPGGRQVLRVIGTVDHRNGDKLAMALQSLIVQPGDLRVDMSAVEFIDIGGLRVLLRTAHRLQDGRRLLVANLAPSLREVIALIGWDDEPRLVFTGHSVRS